MNRGFSIWVVALVASGGWMGCFAEPGSPSSAGLAGVGGSKPSNTQKDPSDQDGDGVKVGLDCDDADPRIGGLLYEHDLMDDDGRLTTGPKLTDPWVIGGGVATNTRGGQQVVLAPNADWSNTVTFARVSAHGLERKCSECGYRITEFAHEKKQRHALWWPGFYDGNSRHKVRMFFRDVAVFRFDPKAGYASLDGVAYVVNLGGGPGTLDEEWNVSMRWSYRGQGPDGEGTGGPKRELSSHQGKDVTDQWHYFDLVEGTLTRADGAATVELMQWPLESRYPLQVGYTASGKNTRYGAATWLHFTHTKADGQVVTGRGDLNADLHERDRFRAGILARAGVDADQDEGFSGYRCAVARNSMVDCNRPGRFVQIAEFMDAPEDNIKSECEQSPGGVCPVNSTFDQLDRQERTEGTDVLEGDVAQLAFWAVGPQLVCEFEGVDGERVTASARDRDFKAGGTGLSVLNALSDFESLRVCEAFEAP